jgi:hypothetical protein
VSRSAAFFASLLVALGRPTWWLVALAGFLARGGIILAILPIVSLPSPLILSNLVAPLILPLALGRFDAGIVAAIAAAAVVLLGWLVVGGLVGAAGDLALIRDGQAAAVEEGATGVPDRDGNARHVEARGGIGVIARILAVRLLAQAPFAVVLAVGAVGIVNVTYAELTRPAAVGTPLVLRVIAGAARPLVAIVVAWFLGEVAGGVAARRVALNGDGVRAALRGAVADVVRRPRSTIIPALVTTIPLVVILGGTLGGARIAWLRTQEALSDPTIDGMTLAVALTTFVAIWLASLVLIGVLTAVRSAALTFEAVRAGAGRAASPVTDGDAGDTADGTFGASTHHRPGDWPVGSDGGRV